MRTVRRPFAGLFVAASLGFVSGCGENTPPPVDSSNTEATVKGVVKVGGAPVTEGGEISFDPTNYQRKDAALRTAEIGKDGTYTVKTLTGHNEVRLGGAVAKKNKVLMYERRTLEVKSGENTFDFEVSTDAKPATK